MNAPNANPNFTTTHWSVVLAARDEASTIAHQALAGLCSTYWYPLPRGEIVRARFQFPLEVQMREGQGSQGPSVSLAAFGIAAGAVI